MEHRRNEHLLGRYVSEGSQAAFAGLVSRHIKLVYSTCYRELGQRELAEEATQAVFLALAQKAREIRSEAALAPWLYRTARFEASDLRKQEQRRMAREWRAAEEASRLREQQEGDIWSGIEPALNDAISALPYSDQQAILLRFFDKLSLREVGQTMGTNEDAARMRVTRALTKLRSALVNRKAATISAVALAALLTKHAVYAVPAHLPASVAHSAAGTLPAPSASGVTRLFRPLNPFIAKGLIIVSTTKIIAGAVVAVLLLVLLFVGVHKLRSSGVTAPPNASAGVPNSAGNGSPSTTSPVSAPGGPMSAHESKIIQRRDANHLQQIALAINAYDNAHGRFPDADRWMDEVEPNGLGLRSGPSGNDYACPYTYNKALSGLTDKDIPNPGSTVMLFDSTANTKNAADTGQSIPSQGWFGGGSNFAFVDCHVAWIKDGSDADSNGSRRTFKP